MTRRLSPLPCLIFIAALLVALPACDEREPPQIDDDELSSEIRSQFQAVQQKSEERHTDASQIIDEARSQIDLAIERADDISIDVFTHD